MLELGNAPVSWKGLVGAGVIVADLDGNTRLDIVRARREGLQIFMQNMDGNFSRQDDLVGDIDLTQASSGTAADFDGDGRPSCLLPQTSFGPQWFALFEVDEGGSVSEKTVHPGSTQGLSWYPAVGDFDGDGDPDIVIGHALPGLVVFLENDTRADQPEQFLFPQTSFGFGFVRHLVVSDLESDGDEDVVVVDYTLDKLVLMRNALSSDLTGRVSGPPTPADPNPLVLERDDLPLGVSPVKWLSDLMPAEARSLSEKRPRQSSTPSNQEDVP